MSPLFPKSTLGRALALLWVLTCVGLLVFAFVQRHALDMPVPFTWLLISLTFPVGLPVGAIVGVLMQRAYANWGLPYDPFLDLLPSWLVMASFGYWQWFIVVPSLAGWLSRRRSTRGRGHP
jgi:biotin transporter BioY